MENSKREIESFLYLYPSAIKYYDSIKYNQQKVSNKQLKQMETFYGILIDIVNDWMKVLKNANKLQTEDMNPSIPLRRLNYLEISIWSESRIFEYSTVAEPPNP